MERSTAVKFRPALESLDSRLQPGSVLSSGTNLSLLGLTLGVNLLPEATSPEAPAHVRLLTGPATSAPTQATDPESTRVPDRSLPGTAIPSEAVTPATSDLQQVIRDIQPDAHSPAGRNRPRILWYNGDYDGRNGLSSEANTIVSDARTYDDFNVTSHHGWDLTHVWGNFQLSSNVQGANFEIRAGVSAGNGGTVVASGTNMPVTLTVHQAGQPLLDITVDVAFDTPLHLDQGTYWLTVQPIGYGAGRAFVSTTSGANAVRTPAGNNGNSFFDSRFFNLNFAATNSTQVLGVGTWDFSYGAFGTVTRPGG